MLDPAECGPAFIGLPQDVQADGLRLPGAALRAAVAHAPPASGPTRTSWPRPPQRSARRERPLVVAGGGVHYSLAEAELPAFVEAHGLPVVETVAGKSCLDRGSPVLRRPDRRHRLPTRRTGWPPRPTSCSPSAPGCRTSRPARGPCSGTTGLTLDRPQRRALRRDKHLALPVVGDAREGLLELGARLGDWRAGADWVARAEAEAASFKAFVGGDHGAGRRAADLRAGDRRRQPARHARPTTRSPPRAACRAS